MSVEIDTAITRADRVCGAAGEREIPPEPNALSDVAGFRVDFRVECIGFAILADALARFIFPPPAETVLIGVGWRGEGDAPLGRRWWARLLAVIGTRTRPEVPRAPRKRAPIRHRPKMTGCPPKTVSCASR